MAFARKCDRCGTLYEIVSPDMFVCRDNYSYSPSRIDLCPACTNMLIYFIEHSDAVPVIVERTDANREETPTECP